MSELKNCPFCGKEVQIIKYAYFSENEFYVICTTSQCLANKISGLKNKQELIEAWNRRPEE